MLVGIDYVLPKQANIAQPDLVLAGPNYGLNVGPYLYAISGTTGAAATAIARGIPAIAFSTNVNRHRPFYWTNASTPAGLQDPATITGRLGASLAQAVIDRAAAQNRPSAVLPLGYGLNVNLPFITSYTDDHCVNPPFVRARMTGGGAYTNKAVMDADTGLFHAADFADDGANACVSGDCSLPGEVEVLNSGDRCKSPVVVFTIDVDAPSTIMPAVDSASLLPDMVQLFNATNLEGGLGPNPNIKGTGAPYSPDAASQDAPTPSANAGRRGVGAVSAGVLAVAAAAALGIM